MTDSIINAVTLFALQCQECLVMQSSNSCVLLKRSESAVSTVKESCDRQGQNNETKASSIFLDINLVKNKKYSDNYWL